MLPLMKMAADGQEYSLREAIENLAQHFRLSDDERQEMLPSGRQATFDNRVGWARTYLKKAGLLKSTRRGYFQITERGKTVIQSNPPSINIKFLDQFDEFLEFRNVKREQSEIEDESDLNQDNTPEENLESIIQGLNQDLASDLLEKIKTALPT